MSSNLTLSVLEISFFLAGAIVLGITLRVFLAKPGKPEVTTDEKGMNNLVNEEWKLKYMTDISRRDTEISVLREQLQESGETVKTLTTEFEELRWQYKRFETVKEQLEKRLRDLDKENNLHRIVMPETTGKLARG